MLFNADVSGCSSVPSRYVWTYNSGSSTSSDTTAISINRHTFTAVGNYTITVSVTCGSTTTTSTPVFVNIHGQPTVRFTTDDLYADSNWSCAPKTIHFMNNSIDADTTCGYSMHWIIDGAVYSGTEVTHTFDTGRYDVTLIFNNTCGCSGTTTYHDFAKVQGSPTACVRRTDGAHFCSAPATAYYNAGCSNGAISYEYHWGDGTVTSTSDSVTNHTFRTAGTTYSEYMYAISSAGCRTMVNLDSDVVIPSIASTLSVSRDTICYFDSITLNASTTGTTASNWTFYVMNRFGDTVNTTSGSTNPVMFNISDESGVTSGVYRAVVVASDGFGCQSSATHSFFVRESPHARVTMNRHFYCTVPVTATISASATYTGGRGPVRYHWYYGDRSDTTTSSATSVHTYTASSTGGSTLYPSLVVSDALGCKDSVTVDTGLTIQTPSFTIRKSADSGCASSTAPLNVDFAFNIRTPATLPFHIDSVLIDSTTNVCVGDACADLTYGFTTAATARTRYYHFVQYYWRLDDSVGGCTGITTDSLRASSVHPDIRGINTYIRTSSGLQRADSICPGTVLYFNDSCTNCSFTSWHIANGIGSAVDTAGSDLALDSTSALYSNYNPFGFILDPHAYTYTARLIVSKDGCFDTVLKYIYVYHPDSGVIVGAPVCQQRDSVQFQWSVRDPSHIRSYHWDFGDGGTSVTSTNSVFHRYHTSVTRSYTVTGVDTALTSDHGCYNRQEYVVTVGPRSLPWAVGNPIRYYDVANHNDTICVGVADSFLGPIQSDGSAYTMYSWNFGDGPMTSMTDTATTHAYSATGIYSTYAVVLTTGAASTTCRDTTSTKRVIVVGPTGGLRVSPRTVCAGTTVSFVDSNTDISPIRRTHHWIFNGSSVPGSSLPSSAIVVAGYRTTSTPPFFRYSGDTSLSFNAAGTYMISLIDTDAHGCASVSNTTVTVSKPKSYCYPADTLHDYCAGTSVPFADTARHCRYSWSFDGGTTWSAYSNADSLVSHTFPTNGTKTAICVIIADTPGHTVYGCVDTTRTTVNLNHFHATMTNLGDVTPVSCPPFRAVMAGSDFSANYTWSVTPTGYTSTGIVFNYDIFGSGHYAVNMVATNTVGCSDTQSYALFIGGPLGYITSHIDSGCNPIPVTLQFVDTGVVSTSYSYIWTACPIGSRTTSTDSVHLGFPTEGTFCPPSLIIQDGACAVVFDYPTDLTVRQIPFVGVTDGGTVCHDSTTTVTARGGDHYHWSPAAGISYYHPGDSTYVRIHPSTTTTYTVIGTTAAGCRDSVTTTVRVDSALHVTISGRDTVCMGLCDTLRASGIEGGVYIWTGGHTSCAVCSSPVACTDTTVEYTLIGADALGCTAIAHHRLYVRTPDTPSVTILSLYDTFCAIHPDTMFADIRFGGNSPYVRWYKNGVYQDTGLYFVFPPNFDDLIRCVVYSNAYCISEDSVSNHIVVNQHSPAIPDVTIHASDDTTRYIGEIVSFFSDVTYGGLRPTFQWYQNDRPIAGATNNMWSDHIYYPCTVYCVLTSNSDCIAKPNDTSNVLHVNVISTGVNEISVHQFATLYPNPTNGNLILAGNLNTGKLHFDVVDVTGRIVHSDDMNVVNRNDNMNISLPESLTTGQYMLRVFNEGSTAVFKFYLDK